MSPKLLYTFLAIGSFALYYLLLNPLWTGVGSVWSPASGGVKELRAQHVHYEEAIGQAQNLFEEGKKLKKDFESIDPAMRTKMAVMVPESIDPVRLLDEITAIAKISGIAVSGLAYTENPGADKLRGGYDVTFTVKTTYDKFKEFMENYEKSLRLFTLQSVTFTAGKTSEELISFQVKLRTHYLK